MKSSVGVGSQIANNPYKIVLGHTFLAFIQLCPPPPPPLRKVCVQNIICKRNQNYSIVMRRPISRSLLSDGITLFGSRQNGGAKKFKEKKRVLPKLWQYHLLHLSATFHTKLLRLRSQGIGYAQICLGSDPLWYRSTLFTRKRFETETIQFHMGSPSQVDPFGAR